MKPIQLLAAAAAVLALCACAKDNGMPDGVQTPETHAGALAPADVSEIVLTRYDESGKETASKTLTAENPFFALLLTLYDTSAEAAAGTEQTVDIRITMTKTDGGVLTLDLLRDDRLCADDGNVYDGKSMREFIYSFAVGFAPAGEPAGE